MKDYISFSAWSRYQKCESCALAIDNEDFKEKATEAMIVSSYIDSLILNETEAHMNFMHDHPEMLKKDGTFKVKYTTAADAVRQATADTEFMEHLKGHRKIPLEGEIAGIKIIGEADVIGEKIVDLKALANFDRVWENRKKISVIESRRYDVQGAVYRELWKQMTGEIIDFEIAALTKEEISQRKIITFTEDDLEYALEEFTNSLERIQDIRAGRVEPTHCGICDHCKLTLPTEEIPFREVGLTQQERQEFFVKEFEERR